MHVAAYTMATEKTIPALRRLRDAAERNANGRTDPYVSEQPERHIAVVRRGSRSLDYPGVIARE